MLAMAVQTMTKKSKAQTLPQPKELSLESNSKKLGVALVGLGKYSKEQLAPALKETTRCRLTGIVTGSPHKGEEWKRKYSIPDRNVYSYHDFHKIKDNADIDIVYVVLPNSMHSDFAIRAAKAGKHVISEKPMDITVKACEDMIDACKENNVMLSIGYRLHFEPYNLKIAELTKEKTLGKVIKITAQHGMDIESNVWRLNKKLAGGGPLMDVGIYCVQAAIYSLGENPIAVTAKEGRKTDLKRFSEVEQSLSWQMEFASGAVAYCDTSYAEDQDLLRADAEKGWIELKPAYAYKGIKGKTDSGKLDLKKVNQQALQMDDFANCILHQEPSRVPGEMGLRDVKILLTIYEAAKTGKRIELKNL